MVEIKEKNTDYYNDSERIERIENETKRLENLLKNIDKDRRKLAEGLLKRAAFMRVTLEDLEHDINTNGTIEYFSQSADAEPYERKRPNVDTYIKLNGNYQNIMKQLDSIKFDEKAGKKKNEKEGDGFDDFVKRR